MCTHQGTQMAAAAGSQRSVGRGKLIRQDKARTLLHQKRTEDTHVLIFKVSPGKWTWVFYQGLGVAAAAAVGSSGAESALWLPEDGDHRGSCGLIPRREVLARVEKSHPECLFLEAHSVGPGSLWSLFSPYPAPRSPTSGASPLPLQLDSSGGLCSWVRVRAHSLGLSQRAWTPGETRLREFFCWKMVGLFLSIFPVGKKRRAGRREGEKGREGKDRREERRKEGR